MAEPYQLTLSMPNVDQQMMVKAFHSQSADLKYAGCIQSLFEARRRNFVHFPSTLNQY